ncbi:MAG TPA: ABC-2 family transporter protein [Firmicutes bacterium]|mgnify:FL=1|nr:ABC-2 family transporter protein [Bacillota bacterium]
MKGNNHKYLRCFSMSVGQTFVYRTDFFIKILATFIPVAVQLFLWTAVYGSSGKETIYGRTYYEMMFYLTISFVITFFLTCDEANEVSADIKSGNLNQFLIRPISYIGQKISCFLGSKVIVLVFVGVMFVATILLFDFRLGYQIELVNLLIFLLIILLALILQFLMYLCMGTCAFWITDAWGIFFGGRYIINILSGSLFPLEVFGDTLNGIFSFLPFQYTTYFPINVLQGRMDGAEILKCFAIQIIWIILLYGLYRLLWSRGQKQYMAIGG